MNQSSKVKWSWRLQPLCYLIGRLQSSMEFPGISHVINEWLDQATQGFHGLPWNPTQFRWYLILRPRNFTEFHGIFYGVFYITSCNVKWNMHMVFFQLYIPLLIDLCLILFISSTHGFFSCTRKLMYSNLCIYTCIKPYNALCFHFVQK